MHTDFVLSSDPTLTEANMTTALDKLPPAEWRTFGYDVDIPKSKLDEIKSQYSSDEERKTEVVRVYLTQHPHPSWEHVSDMLYLGGTVVGEQYHIALGHLQSMFPTGEGLQLSSHIIWVYMVIYMHMYTIHM